MPGVRKIADELSMSSKTVIAALAQLSHEGLLEPQGPGRRCRIAASNSTIQPTLRIAILLYEEDDRKIDYLLELLYKLREAGHTVAFAPKSLVDMNMDVKKVAKLVDKYDTDAWVVASGSRPVMEWFEMQSFPVFGLFGRVMNMSIARSSSKKIPALEDAVQRLVSLGHRRIVMLAREDRRKPAPGFLEKAYLKILEDLGIVTGTYNLPDWEESPQGFRQSLDMLFQHTPPTAFLIPATSLTVAVLQYCAINSIVIPRDLSLICMDPDPLFAWCDPAISHISYDSRPWLRHIVRWANNVASGKDDRSVSAPLAKFIEGGTIGVAKNKNRF